MTKKHAEENKSKLSLYNNLLGISFVRWIVKLPVFPYFFQVAALAVFLSLIYFGWGQPIFEFNSAAEKLYRKLNLTTFVVW